jgi:hypothetical protein
MTILVVHKCRQLTAFAATFHGPFLSLSIVGATDVLTRDAIRKRRWLVRRTQ